MFENLDEIYEEITNLMRNNKPILFEENNKIIISIPISTTKIKELKFILYKKEKSDKERIDDLYSIINDLRIISQQQNSKIEEQNHKIENQNKKINELNDKIIELNEKLENQNRIIKEISKNKEKLNKIITQTIFNDSLIINKNEKYISYLNEWLSKDNIYFKTQLLFRKSINGDSYNEFHRLCDNQGKTITLIQTKDGLIIGGYTIKNQDTSGKWSEDYKAFIFSLNKGRVFPIKKNCSAILGRKDHGPWFAYIGFGCTGRQNLSQGEFVYKNKTSSNFDNYDEIIPNDHKGKFFDVVEVEIIYNNL